MTLRIVAAALLVFTSVAHAASFDCAKASTLVENAICSDSQLSDLDDLLMQSYRKALVNAPDANRLKADQRAWLKNVRNQCKDATCLKRAYNDRLAVLNSVTASSQKLVVPRYLILNIKADSNSKTEKNVTSKMVEVTGVIFRGHDAGGGNFKIKAGKKRAYTLGYIWHMDDATQEKLQELADSNVTVTVKGALNTWKDGSAAFDTSKPIQIYK